MLETLIAPASMHAFFDFLLDAPLNELALFIGGVALASALFGLFISFVGSYIRDKHYEKKSRLQKRAILRSLSQMTCIDPKIFRGHTEPDLPKKVSVAFSDLTTRTHGHTSRPRL